MRGDVIAISAITRVEAPAAIWRKQRLGELETSDAALLVREFSADLFGAGDEPPRFAVVALASRVLESAASLLAGHCLRAYDAVQLASALAARDADPLCTGFACFDRELSDAAATNGFELLPG